jgi:hypothetical protein
MDFKAYEEILTLGSNCALPSNDPDVWGWGVACSMGFLFTVWNAVMARVQRGAQNP